MFWMGPRAWKKGIVYTTEKLTGLGASEGQLAKAKASRVWSQTHVPHCVAQWTISTLECREGNGTDDVGLPPGLMSEQKHP